MTTPIHNECEYDQHLRAYVDRDLSEEKTAKVRGHLSTCDTCREALSMMTAIDGELAAWRGAAQPDAALRERIASALATEPKPVVKRAPVTPRRILMTAAATTAFGLLFAVVAIPMIAKSREKARQVEAQSNLKQLGIGFTQYVQDYDEKYPTDTTFDANQTPDRAANKAVSEPVQPRLPALPRFQALPLPVAPPEPGSSGAAQIAQPPARRYDAIPREIIYTAQVAVTVARLGDAERQITAMVAARRGYIAQSNIDAGNADAPTGSWTVRVPVDQFEAFMGDITRLGKVVNVHRDSQDVTQEYFDLQSHIANKQIEEARLKEYMQHKSQRLSDILTLESELSRVRGEIEEMQGRLRLMGHQADLSTVTITLSEARKSVAPPPVGVAAQIGASFTGALSDIGAALRSLAIWLAGALPYLAMIAVCGWLVRKAWRRTVQAEVR